MVDETMRSDADRPPFEKITDGERILAIIVRSSFAEAGIHFFSEAGFSQQLGFMRRPAGHVVVPHEHKAIQREVVSTQEVLFIRSGSARVDLYREDRSLLTSRFVGTGDVVLLAEGGHGLEILEESEIVEVKQGPYTGDADKVRFEVAGS